MMFARSFLLVVELVADVSASALCVQFDEPRTRASRMRP